jgi:hypothetical protein
MPLFSGPSKFDDTYESKVLTLQEMDRIANARNTSQVEAAKDVNRYASNDVRLRPALAAGHDLGDAVRRYRQGDFRALDCLRSKP